MKPLKIESVYAFEHLFTNFETCPWATGSATAKTEARTPFPADVHVCRRGDGAYNVHVTTWPVDYEGPKWAASSFDRIASAIMRDGQRLNLGHLGILELKVGT